MTHKEAMALTGRIVWKDSTNYTVTSASTTDEICVWNPNTQTLIRFDSRETFENWAYGTPVPSAGRISDNTSTPTK